MISLAELQGLPRSQWPAPQVSTTCSNCGRTLVREDYDPSIRKSLWCCFWGCQARFWR
jgi:hypothetical protein